MSGLPDFLAGATSIACLVIAVFFTKFWRQTSDRLFAIFGFAFFVFAINRFTLIFLARESEARAYLYLGRLLMFVLILAAIVDKNIRPSARDR